MTTTYTPDDPAYFDERDLRVELGRVFDLCHGCRLCFNLCPSFPTLFGIVDAHDGDVPAMTASEQDRVVDECYQCKLCYPKCPYVPPHDWQLDFPRLMLRAQAVRRARGTPVRERVTDQVLARTDLVGRVATAAAPVANALTGTPGSLARRALERTAGLASQRLLPPYARTRFSSWFRHRGSAREPMAFVVRARTGIGVGLPDVLRRVPRAGDRPGPGQGVRAQRGELLAARGDEVLRGPVAAPGERQGVPAGGAHATWRRWLPRCAAGREVVVAQPTCAYVVRKDYPVYLAGTAQAADAELVAAHTADPAEYLMALHRGEGTSLDTAFPGRASGAVPDQVTYHVACHLQAQHIGLKGRDLLKVAGIRATLVQRCSGVDGTWGLRAANYELARSVARPMADEMAAAGNRVVCGDCHLANGAIEQETGMRPVHPVQLLARAYGIPEEPT